MLVVEDLHVEVEGKPILKGIDLEVGAGETHVLLGPNGGGKTTLLMAIMGMPRYRVTRGAVYFKGKDITSLTPDARARLGIGMMFQKPPAVRGVKLREIAQTVASVREVAHPSAPSLEGIAERLNLSGHLDRELNYGFSGGELKRSEMFQLLCQAPELVLLDEPESGVDLDNIALIGEAINDLLGKREKIKERKASGVIVTHTGHILRYVNADKGHILIDGKIACHGNPRDLFEEVQKHGYGRCQSCR
ncbi:MAG: ABC transporter ATP-binding protein [Firmicutes bacterium]|nr:ABC transporter ATP-binding protein [Candidatus Fermentithermobacillaceae bacterium]